MVSMAPVLRPRALDGTTRPNIDALGIGYLVIAIAYTLLLAAELYLLYRRREAFCVRIRNIRVVFAAVLMLHIYLVLVLLVYPWNGLFPCSAEFWIMSVFLPSGMAFFQSKSLSSGRTCSR
jgi:predicted acyltransferase